MASMEVRELSLSWLVCRALLFACKKIMHGAHTLQLPLCPVPLPWALATAAAPCALQCSVQPSLAHLQSFCLQPWHTSLLPEGWFSHARHSPALKGRSRGRGCLGSSGRTRWAEKCTPHLNPCLLWRNRQAQSPHARAGHPGKPDPGTGASSPAIVWERVS